MERRDRLFQGRKPIPPPLRIGLHKMKALVRLSLPPLAFAFAVLACSAAGFDQPEAVEVVFLNVGQGDATLIRSPEGKVWTDPENVAKRRQAWGIYAL